MMTKTDLLLHMMEQPHEYSEQQWQEILADEECRELYTLMSDIKSACDVQHDISDEAIDAEWQRLQKRGTRRWLRIAAMLAGVVMLSGIAFAAIRIAHQHQEQETPLTADTTAATHPSSPVLRPSPPTYPKDTITTVFDNESLDKIVAQIATYHCMEAEIENEQAYDLRFYFVWRQQDSLSTVVEQLNQFERVNIVMERTKLIVR